MASREPKQRSTFNVERSTLKLAGLKVGLVGDLPLSRMLNV
jgi:hypothetical protein